MKNDFKFIGEMFSAVANSVSLGTPQVVKSYATDESAQTIVHEGAFLAGNAGRSEINDEKNLINHFDQQGELIGESALLNEKLQSYRLTNKNGNEGIMRAVELGDYLKESEGTNTSFDMDT